jgi:hypothetical protein
MRTRRLGGRAGRRIAGAAAAVVLLGAVAGAPPAGSPGDGNVEGGRLSHLCRAGLWVMGTGHVGTGGLLMWLGC